ncbi:MAG: hypothetical protein KF841_09815 [Phycisphaerae bacterium]|nr:hypothetical protein [Phycisphaerae bacterium]
MQRLFLKSLAYGMCATALVVGFACDKQPSQQTPAAVSPSSNTKTRDSDALAEYLNKDAAPASSAQQGLPPGHPPLNSTPPARPADAGAAALPPGHPPLGGGPEPMTAPSKGSELQYETPDSWSVKPVTSSLRKANYGLPRAEGDPEDAELIVFYFGPGQGGSVEANLERWKGMFVGEDGSALPESASTVDEFQAGGMKVTVLNVTGRYVASNMMTGQRSDPTASDYRMLAAVVETGGGPWFFRALGPAKTIAMHEASIRQMLSTVRQ